jgi:hypothetical protein
MKNKNKKYWAILESIALKEGDLEYANYCQKKKHEANQFVSNKIK